MALRYTRTCAICLLSLSHSIARSAALHRRGRDCHAVVCLHLLPFSLCFSFFFVGCLAAPGHICRTSHLLSTRGAHSSDKQCSSSTLLFWRWQKTIICIINGMSLRLPASKMLSKANNMEQWLTNLPLSCFKILYAQVNFLHSTYLK